MFSDGNVDASLTKFMGACENFPFLVVTLFHQVVGGINPALRWEWLDNYFNLYLCILK